MESTKKINNRIDKWNDKLISIINSIAEEKHKRLLSTFTKTYEKEVNVGTKKEPKMVMAKFGVFYQRIDGAKKPSFVERNIMYELDGQKMFGMNRPMKKYTVGNLSHFLEMIGE